MTSQSLLKSDGRAPVHFVTRGIAASGISVLIWLEFQRRYLPGLLPVPGWAPVDSYHKWLGIGIHAIDLLFGLSALLVAPALVWTAFGALKSPGERWQCWIDLFFVLLYYFAFVLSVTIGVLS